MVQKSNRTQRINQTQIKKALENIYISPSEVCNLRCRYCYTHKNKPLISEIQIQSFIKNYSSYLKSIGLSLKSILFCGGEVFTLPWFTNLVNQLIKDDIFITIITNGTVDKLDQITSPQNCQIIVSLDGPKTVHDYNRGHGNYVQSTNFITKAISLGFPTEIFYLVTDISYPYIDSFLGHINKLYGQTIGLSFLTDRLGSLSQNQILNIKLHYPTYPSPRFGCFQLAVQSDGQIYGCCESNIPLANITDSPQNIITNFLDSLNHCQKCIYYGRSNVFLGAQSCEQSDTREHPKKSLRDRNITCFGCCQPNYLCGYIKELHCQNCQQVVVKFNKYAK